MPPPAPWKSPSPLPARFETRRLIIRFWEQDDAPSMLEGLTVDRTVFAPWLPWIHTDNRTLAECIYTIERFRRIREQADPPPVDYAFGIFDKATGAAVGGTSLHRMEHAAHHAEIGYYIRADRQRSGLCTEAVAGLVTWAFTPQASGGWGLRRLDIYCSAKNIASQGVPRRLGLRKEVDQPAKRWTEGHGWDGNLGWGVLVDEWDIANQALKSRA